MATAYHRDQPGAPALVYSTAANNIAHFTAFKTVLKACLVTGYGALPAAGWLLINEGTNFIVLRTGSLSGYVCLTWVSGAVVRVYLAETYTGMSGDVMVGDGLKSGNADGVSLPQTLPAFYLAYDSGNTNWTVVADSKTFVLVMAGNFSNSELDGALSYRAISLYAGEDSAGALIALGGSATTSTSGSSVPGYFSSFNGFTALKDPATGLLVGGAAINVSIPVLARNVAISPSLQTVKLAGAQLVKAVWSGNSILSGALRGVSVVADLTNVTSASQGAQCLGRTTAMKIRDANAPIDLGDGHVYLVGVAHLASFFLLTDNPAFW